MIKYIPIMLEEKADHKDEDVTFNHDSHIVLSFEGFKLSLITTVSYLISFIVRLTNYSSRKLV